MVRYIRIFALTMASLLAAVLLPSCSSEDSPRAGGSGRVTFAAAIGRQSSVDTRAGITFEPVKRETYGNIPFYIKAEISGDISGGSRNETAVYQVSTGMVGRLVAATGEEEIMWYNQSNFHTFYAWTMPWKEDDMTDPDADSEISFLPSDYQDAESNCGVLERFVAAKTQPLTYDSNGELVEMYFQHLVSRIRINFSRLVGNNNSSYFDEGAEAYITLLDMPQAGTFHRRPAGTTDVGRAPYVEKIEDENKGVTYRIGSTSAILYVCPEVDFAQMRFAIHLNDGKGNRGDYYGSFNSVKFLRPDEELGTWDDGKRTTVLYAGEEMTINIAIRNNDVPNFTVNINPWNDKFREGVSQAKPGVYTPTEIQDIYNRFTATDEDGKYTYTQEDIDDIFDLFGDVDEDGNWVINMYEDLKTTHTRFPLDPSFILDGMGHVLEMANAHHEINGRDRPYCAHVPRCRNIFLTNGDGKHMIYIDDEYRIWIVDPDTLEMKDTGNVLQELPSNRKSYYIDYETGEIYLSSNT